MSKPSLSEVLKKHKGEQGHTKHANDSGHAKVDNGTKESTRHVALDFKTAKTLFLDLPKEHKFWIKNGKEVNNLTELYKSLIEMDEAVYKHHANKKRDDFAKWVDNVLGDTILSRRLKASTTKVEHVEQVKKRIDELRYSGTRIPTPHTKLRPNYGFIQAPEKPAPVRAPPVKTNHGFSLKGAPLLPDSSFIITSRRAQESQYGQMLDTQQNMLDQVHRDVDEQEQIIDDIHEIKQVYTNFSGELTALRNEIAGVKSELRKDRLQHEELDQQRVKELKTTISGLREQEKDILGELKFISATEEKIVNKNEVLMDKEMDLEKKENIVLKKEEHYNKLMEKYDQMLKSIKQKMDTDEKKVQELLSGKTKKMIALKHSPIHRRGDHLTPKTKKSVKEMINKTLSGRGHMLEQMEIDDMISDARILLKNKKFAKLKESLDHVKKKLKSNDLDKEYKKNAYFTVFELSTDMDLLEK